MTYEAYQADLAPPWLQGPEGRKWMQGRGAAKDQFVALVVAAVLARFASTAPEDALPLIGKERLLSRHPGERVDAYRARLVGAFEFWRLAGTLPGVELAIDQLGYTASIIYCRRYDPTRTHEFIPVIRPGDKHFGTPLWGADGLWGDDDQMWGLDLTDEERQRIRYVLNLVKPSHTKMPDIIWYAESGAIWGEGGLWDNDGLWESARVSPI